MIKNHSESDWEPKNRKNIRICDDMLIRHLLYRQKTSSSTNHLKLSFILG
jgi:hypothetical protein